MQRRMQVWCDDPVEASTHACMLLCTHVCILHAASAHSCRQLHSPFSAPCSESVPHRCRFSFRRSPFSAFSAFSAFGAFSWRRSLEGFASAGACVAAGVGLPRSLLRTDLASSPADATVLLTVSISSCSSVHQASSVDAAPGT
jgi:hypothetical protein